MLHRFVVLLLAAALVAPVAAVAQGPFAPLPPSQQPAETVAPRPTGEAEEDGLSDFQQLMIFVGGVALIAAIGFGIMADARRRAPVEDERAYYRHRSADERETKRKVDRSKTRAQKQARKRQRAKR